MNRYSFSGNDLIVETSRGVTWIDLRQVSSIQTYTLDVALLNTDKTIATLSIFTTNEAVEKYNLLGESEKRTEMLKTLREELINNLKKAISDVRAANV